MAIGTPVNLGTQTTQNSAASTIPITTSAAGSGSGRVVAWFVWQGAVTASSVSGGGLTWTIDKQVAGFAVCSAAAPAGWTSGTVITLTLSGASTSSGSGAAMFLPGAETGASFIDGTPAGATGTGTTWLMGSVTISFADSIVIGAVFGDTTSGPANTPTGSPLGIEVHDNYNSGFGVDLATEYLLPGATGAYNLGGTFNFARSIGAQLGIAYRAAGSATAPSPLLTMIRRGGLQRARALLLMQPRPVVAAIATADLSASLAGDSAITANLTAPAGLGSALAGAGAIVATLSVPAPLSSTLAGTSAISAALTAASQMSATLAGAGSLSAALTASPRLSATLAGAGAINASLTSPAGMSATLAGAGSIAGGLTASPRIAASLVGTGAIAAGLTASSRMSTTLAGVGSISATLTVPGPALLVATLTGTGTLTGALTASTRLSATLGGAGAIAASLTASVRLSASLAGAGALSAALFTPTAATLSASLVGSGTITATLVISVPIGVRSPAGRIAVPSRGTLGNDTSGRLVSPSDGAAGILERVTGGRIG